MTATDVVALSAVLSAGAVAAMVMAATGSAGAVRARPDGSSTPNRGPRTWVRRLPLGIALGLGVWAVTGWPTAGLWLGALAVWIPSLVTKGRQRRAELARAAGIARLAAMLRDQVLVGADVAEAIRGCVFLAPTTIAPAVAELSRRLEDGHPEDVLGAFAAEVNDPMADLLAVGLRFALTRRAAKVADLFDEVARATEEQVRIRRSVEKDRRRLRTAMWSVLSAIVAWLVLIYLVSGSYLSPYDGVAGQEVMALAGAAFAAGLVGLAKMDNIGGPRRLGLGTVDEP